MIQSTTSVKNEERTY